MKKLGLIGNPLGHSWSPEIHRFFIKQDYNLFPLQEDELDAFLKAKEFDGINVTIPYKETVIPYLDELDEKGVKNILALRGDVNPDFAIEKDFKYASDLTEYIMSKNRGFNVSGACYPEVHQEAANMIEDIQNLKKKVDSGADHLISQLFFDDQVFFDFQEKARIAGINVPIEAGIMPVTNKKQIERMVSMCGASIPAKLSKVLQRFGDNHEAMRDAGISYAIDQIIELAAHGVDGVHIYTMNDPYVARRISEGVKNILKSGK